MTLTQMQIQYIMDNPTMSARKLSDKLGCSPTTASDWKKKILGQGVQKDDNVQKSVQSDCARATINEVSKLDTQSSLALLTPEQLGNMQSIFCYLEFNLYQNATKKLMEKPNDLILLGTQRQHADQFQKGMFLMGKWYGMEKQTVNVNVTKRLLTEKDIDNMSFDDIMSVAEESWNQQKK